MRLTPSLDLDPAFGDDGKTRYLAQIAKDDLDCMYAANPLIQPGRIIAGVQACIGNVALAQATMGVENDLLFADGLDWGFFNRRARARSCTGRRCIPGRTPRRPGSR